MLTTSSLFSSLLATFITPGAPEVETVAFFSPSLPSSPSRVETVSGWRKQAKAEESAGLSDSRNTILIKDLLCDICTIGVGKDHYERQLYLYPVHPGTRECIGDTRTTFTEHKFLQICGDCAERRNITRTTHPELLMVEEDYFLTNALFCPKGEVVRDLDPRSELDMQRAKKALREHIARFTKEQQARLFPPPPSPTTNTTTRNKQKPVQKNHSIYQQERRQAVAL